MFGFTKSLEEIDEMDVGRLSRAVEALDYERAWQAFKGGDMTDLGKVHELKMAAKRLNP